jgi:uncharacterized protein
VPSAADQPLRPRDGCDGRPALIVIAKAPVAGRSKTRLMPPCTPIQAAALAEAALRDTLEAVAATPSPRRVVALDGEPGPWLPAGFEVFPQRGAGLAERLAAAFEDVGEAALLVGMDTPQVTPALLGQCARELARPDADAVLGLAADGGYWAVGLRRPDARVFAGVPMSEAGTGRVQRTRLEALGLRVGDLPPLRDVDDWDDARAVAAARPGSRFSAALARVAAEVERAA